MSPFQQLKAAGWVERFWDTGRPKEVYKGHIEAGTAWSVGDYAPDPHWLIENAITLDGIPFAPLEELVKWKSAARRPKDLVDLELIAEYQRKATATQRVSYSSGAGLE